MQITVAGLAASGKGTLARTFAAANRIPHVDIGLIFRAGVFAFPDHPEKALMVARIPDLLSIISYEWNGTTAVVRIRGKDATRMLLSEEVAIATSRAAAIPKCFCRLENFAKSLLEGFPNVICDGRNAGTTILSHAPFKFYAVADIRIRARRRFEDLRRHGCAATYEEVLRKIQERDEQDQIRTLHPLTVPAGATTLDTGSCSPEVCIATMERIVYTPA